MKTTALPDSLHKDLVKFANVMGMKVRAVVERAIEEYLGLTRKEGQELKLKPNARRRKASK